MPRHVGEWLQALFPARFADTRQGKSDTFVSSTRDIMTTSSRTWILLFLAVLSACSPRLRTGAVADSALADTLKGLIEEAYDFNKPNVLTRMGQLYPD